jgi:hypothetical protein
MRRGEKEKGKWKGNGKAKGIGKGGSKGKGDVGGEVQIVINEVVEANTNSARAST